MRLKDKVALITGAGSGIGQATAVLFAREGARVAVVDLREDAAKATAEQIEKSGGQALAIRADVSKSADNQAAVQQAVARWGRLDIFYANAGVPQFPTPRKNDQFVMRPTGSPSSPRSPVMRSCHQSAWAHLSIAPESPSAP